MPARTKSRRFAGLKLPGIGVHNRGRKPFYKEHRHDCIEAPRNEVSEIVENNSFLFTPAVQALALEDVSKLHEAPAFELFKSLRFYDNGAGAYCPLCQSRNLYVWRHRGFMRTWKCQECLTEFSVTTATLFHHRKLSFRLLLMILAVTLGKSQCASVYECAVRLGINYKSIHAIISKVREIAGKPALPDNPAATPTPTPIQIGRDRYIGGRLLSTRTWWSGEEKEAAIRFINGGHTPNEVELALGRTAKSIAYYSRDLRGVKLTPAWTELITPRGPGGRRIDLAYPYIAKSRPEHADILALNDIVPRSFPDQMRADICQEMMLAVLEGTVTIEEVKANRSKSAWFFKKFYMANHEAAGHAISLTGFDEEDRSYDEIASSIASQDWHANQVYERTKCVNALSIGFQPPTQIDDVWHSQINRAGRFLSSKGQPMAFADVAEIVENGEIRSTGFTPNSTPHFVKRIRERTDIPFSDKDFAALTKYVRAGAAEFVRYRENGATQFRVAFKGTDLMVIYDQRIGTLVTAWPAL